MKLTKKSHATVRLEKDGRTLVLDPGVFTEPDATEHVDAILITHEHSDHFNEELVRMGMRENPGAEIWTLRAVADNLGAAFPGRVHTVGRGDAFTAAGFDVQVYGEWHAVIHPDIPRITNVGYLVDGSLFHPGDALTVPDQPVQTLLFPVMAPWNKIGEVVDYIREVKPQRAIDVHDALLDDSAWPIYANVLSGLVGSTRARMSPGESSAA
jgi:L-ascorbate metabolism protein UlaG (beta-lactamase superfamily)